MGTEQNLDWVQLLCSQYPQVRNASEDVRSTTFEQIGRALALAPAASSYQSTLLAELLPASIRDPSSGALLDLYSDRTVGEVLAHTAVLHTTAPQIVSTWNLSQCIDAWIKNSASDTDHLTNQALNNPSTITTTNASYPNTTIINHNNAIMPMVMPGSNASIPHSSIMSQQQMHHQQKVPEFAIPISFNSGIVPSAMMMSAMMPGTNMTVSEAARKEAAAAARAARVAKRREEKRRQIEKLAAKGGPAVLTTNDSGISKPTSNAAAIVGRKAQRRNTGGVTTERSEMRAIKNRESAAKSRAKKAEYTNALEIRVQELRTQNKELRTRVITLAQAPADPHAGALDGQPLRRTRTTPI